MAVKIRDLKKSFGEKEVLTGVNGTLEDDSVYCLMGSSGMGKTTLLRILLGHERADSGKIMGIKPADISVMYQEDRLVMDLTAVQNVALVSKKRVNAAALSQELSRILPENCLNQPVSELSGGMKRRVALARAMFYPSKMVVLDEPFTGLDQNTRMEVISYILDHREGRILLVATHGVQDAAMLGAVTLRLDEMQGVRKAAEGGDSAAPVLSREEILSQTGMFRGIAPERYAPILQKLGAYENEYGKGELICEQFDECPHMGIILAGTIQAEDQVHEEPHIIQRFEAGETFAESVAFCDVNSPAAIRAIAPAHILFVPAAAVLEHSHDPEIHDVMVNLLLETYEKINFLTMKAHLFSEPRLRTRIMSYFYTLRPDQNGWRHIPFTQKDLALFLNVSKEGLNRELARMVNDGLIEHGFREQKIRLLGRQTKKG